MKNERKELIQKFNRNSNSSYCSYSRCYRYTSSKTTSDTDVTKKNNVDISKINQLNSILDAQTLLASGDADAVVSTVSSLAVFENAGLGNIIIDSSNDSSLSSGFLFAGRSQWLKENPKAAIAISKALICSQEEAEKSPTDVYKNQLLRIVLKVFLRKFIVMMKHLVSLNLTLQMITLIVQNQLKSLWKTIN